MMKNRALAHSVSFSFEFSHPIEEVWPLVTNTDRINQAVGNPHVDYRNDPDPRGGSVRFGKFKAKGLTFEWLEHPYEWVFHKYFEVRRDYTAGPLKEMDVRW